MNNRLQSLFDIIEKQRHQLLLSLEKVSTDKLNHNGEGKWSVNHIIAHLIAAEQLSVNYLSKKIQGIEQSDDTGLFEEAKMLMLIISQRLPFKFKAPQKVVETTSATTEFNILAEQWSAVRAELKLILDRIEDRQINRKVYRHVRVGMLNIQHALKFFHEHVVHHLPQIKRQL